MKSKTVLIINKMGFHARAAAKFVHKANDFQSRIFVTFNNQTVNGKSIMGLLMLAAPYGGKLEIAVTGSDEESALENLIRIVEEGFNETL
jgi:phosphocarrier protein HPr